MDLHTRKLLRSHIPALDGVRGVAVLLVLIFHFSVGAQSVGLGQRFGEVAAFGWTGVDLFFVLSGFLITGILYDARTEAHYFRNFYARRALRIFPLYFVGIAVALLLIVLWPPMRETATGGFLYLLTYTANINIAANGWLANPEILSHYWTLSIEEQFYLFWPLAVLYLSRAALMLCCLGIGLVTLGARVTMLLSDVDPVAIFVLTATRIDSLALGAFCALALRGPADLAVVMRAAKATLALAAFGIAALIITWHSVNEYHPAWQSVGFSFIALGSASFIVLSIFWWPTQALMTNSALRWLGRYSYGLYIWHYIFYFPFFERHEIKRMVDIDTKFEAVAYTAVPIALTFLAAVAGYHFIERPFLRLKHRFA